MNNHERPNPTEYALGFAFETRGSTQHVCLILKQKPLWQRGLLNGVGGKIEPGETPVGAMKREFLEETGLFISSNLWHQFHTMRFANGAVVHCFTAHLPAQPPQQMETELPMLCEVGPHGEWIDGGLNIVSNLRWLLPMAYHQLMEPTSERMIAQ